MPVAIVGRLARWLEVLASPPRRYKLIGRSNASAVTFGSCDRPVSLSSTLSSCRQRRQTPRAVIVHSLKRHSALSHRLDCAESKEQSPAREQSPASSPSPKLSFDDDLSCICRRPRHTYTNITATRHQIYTPSRLHALLCCAPPPGCDDGDRQHSVPSSLVISDRHGP